MHNSIFMWWPSAQIKRLPNLPMITIIKCSGIRIRSTNALLKLSRELDRANHYQIDFAPIQMLQARRDTPKFIMHVAQQIGTHRCRACSSNELGNDCHAKNELFRARDSIGRRSYGAQNVKHTISIRQSVWRVCMVAAQT